MPLPIATLDGILGYGREINATPEQTAAAVRSWQSDMANYAVHEGPAGEGLFHVDRDAETAIEGLKQQQAAQWLMANTADAPGLLNRAQAAKFDLEAMVPEDAKVWGALEGEMEKPVFRGPRRQQVNFDVGGTSVNAVARTHGENVDVLYRLPDGQSRMARLKAPTEEDVKSESAAVAKQLEELKNLRVPGSVAFLQQMPGFSSVARAYGEALSDPVKAAAAGGPEEYERRREELRGRLAALEQGGAGYLLRERLAKEMQSEKYDAHFPSAASPRALGSKFLSGLARASLGAKGVVDMTGLTDVKDTVAAEDALRTVLPSGSTAQARAGFAGRVLLSADEAIGQMTPGLIGGGGARAFASPTQLAKMSAGRLGVLGAEMSVQAGGSGFAEAERSAQAVESTDPQKAARIRKLSYLHALLTGLTEGVVERVGAAQMLGPMRGRVGREMFAEALEEPLAGGIQRQLINPVTLGRNEAVFTPMPEEAATGLVAAGPVVGLGSMMNREVAPPEVPANAAVTDSSSSTAPSSAAATAAGADLRQPQSLPATSSAAPAASGVPSSLSGIAMDAGQSAVLPVPSAADAGAANQAQGPASGLPSGAAPQAPSQGPAPIAEVPAGTGSPVTVTSDAAAVQPSAAPASSGPAVGAMPARARMAQRVLENQGVEPDVAAHMAVVLDGQVPADAAAEDFRAAVLEGFEQAGGRFPGRNESGAVLNTDPAYWTSLGYTPEQAAEAVKNSQDWIAEDARQAGERNRGLMPQKGGGLTTESTEVAEGSGGKGFDVSMMKNGRQGQGGFVQLPPGLAGAMDYGSQLLRQGVRDFARWSAAMLKRFGEAIRQYLQGVWEAATKTSQSGFVLNPAGMRRAVRTGTTSAPGERSTVAYQGSGPFRVQEGIKRAILKGTTLPTEFAAEIASTRDAVEAVKNAASRIARDLDGEIRRQAALGVQTREQIEHLVNDALDDPARMAMLGTLNTPLHSAAVRARNMLDQLSQAIASQAGGQVGNTIMSNLGSWMRRSYMAFDPSTRWNLDNLRAAARRGRNLIGQPAAQILRNAEAYLRSQTPGMSAGQLEYQMRQLTDRTVWMGVLTGDPNTRTTKDVSSLIRRRDIDPALRALMGEVRDPLARFAKSADWQAQFVARHEMQSRMRDLGLTMGVFSNQPVGVYTVKVGGEEGPTRAWSGFGDDLYTTPEMMEALRNAQGVMTGTDLGGWFLNTIKFLGGEAKLNKVALNPDSWMVNLFGNLNGLVASGDALSLQGWRNILRAWYQTRLAGRRMDFTGNPADRAAIESARQLQARLEAAGVLNGGFDLQDLMANLNNTVRESLESTRGKDAAVGAVRGAMVGGSIGGVFGGAGRFVGAGVGAAAGGVVGGKRIVEVQKKFAEWLISKPDNFAKTVSYLNNFESYMRSGMTANQAHARVVEIVRDTLPDYSKLPALARELSRFGVLGSFIAFQMEVYRNVYHNIRYAAQELRTGNPELMKRGASRLLGVSSMLTLGGWAAVSALMFGKGEDDEKDEAYRRGLARPWDANSPLWYSQLDSKQASFWNMGYLIPQATIFDIVRGAMSGRSFGESLGNAYDVMTKQFADGGVHTNPILEGVMNSRRGGGKVSYEEGVLPNAWERFEHARKNILTPGYVDKLQRVARAVMGLQRGDRVYTVDEELKRLLGIRQSTYTHDESIAGRLVQFRERADSARQVAKMAYNEWGQGKPNSIGAAEQQKALDRANATRAQIEADYHAWLADLAKLGISRSRVERVKKDRSAQFSTEPLKITRNGVETRK